MYRCLVLIHKSNRHGIVIDEQQGRGGGRKQRQAAEKLNTIIIIGLKTEKSKYCVPHIQTDNVRQI